MKQLTFELFDTFQCIGSSCPDTCCASWGIEVDPASVDFYRNLKNNFGQKLQQNLIESNKKVYMKLQNNRCPFLNGQNLCDIYIHLGPEKMCQTCKIYPRFQWKYGDILFRGLGISCPEVARLILSYPDTLYFDFAEDPSIADSSNSTENWQLFNTLINGMTASVNILQNRSLSIFTRLRLMVAFNDALKTNIDSAQDSYALFETFSDHTQFDTLTHTFATHSKSILPLLTFALHFYKNAGTFRDLYYIAPYTETLYDTLTFCNSLTNQQELTDFWDDVSTDFYPIRYEQYSIYYLTRHYMSAYHNNNIQKCIANLIYLFSLHRLFAFGIYRQKGERLSLADLVPIYTAISRFFEHTDSNLDTLYQLFSDNDMNTTSFLLSLI